MSTESGRKTEKYLNCYEVMLDYWSNEEGDTHLMADYRELLQDDFEALTNPEKSRLSALDAKAKALLDAYHGDETWDVKMLRQVVAIAYPEYRQVA